MKKNWKDFKVKEYLMCILVAFGLILLSAYIIPQVTTRNDCGIYRLRVWNELLLGGLLNSESSNYH